jgi:hypothetical protein
MLKRIKKYILFPSEIFKLIIKKFPFSLNTKINFDVFDRPNYAWSIYMACKQAKKLNLKEISVIEFGVAKGHGLLQMEKLSSIIGAHFKIKIQVYGFDLGTGMPESNKNYKDLPYVWEKGYYKMDVKVLKSKLKKSKLILGDIKKTIKTFEKYSSAPIGFISFDLDYYSSTNSAFEIFNLDQKTFLPRVLCYFDDIRSDNFIFHTEYSGVLLSIKEFNKASKVNKITKLNLFEHSRYFKMAWNAHMYAFHSFKHPKYNINLQDKKEIQYKNL